MRFLVMVEASKDSEAGVLPSAELLNEMGRYNEELVKAGIMKAGEGLHPSAKGARVFFKGNQKTVVDGPFAETKELVAGFWIWECKSKEEALQWLMKCPSPHPGQEAQIELRQIFAPDDFAPSDPTGEIRQREEALRQRMEGK